LRNRYPFTADPFSSAHQLETTYFAWQDDKIHLGDADGSLALLVSPGMVDTVVKKGFRLDATWALMQFDSHTRSILDAEDTPYVPAVSEIRMRKDSSFVELGRFSTASEEKLWTPSVAAGEEGVIQRFALYVCILCRSE
jgi:hypothetical protein